MLKTKFNISLLSSLALPVVFSSQVYAQEQPESPEEKVSIVVTGQGLGETPAAPAYSSTRIDREQIIASSSGRIEDVLSSVAGFQQFRRSDSRSSNPSAQGVTLRALGGNATSRALVLLDGVPMADPFFGYIPLSAIAPEGLDNIRVTRGGGAGPFGAGALAGTIELASADADTLGGFNGSVLVNNRGDTETSGSIAKNLGAGFAVVSGRLDRGRGFYTAPTNQRVPASARAAFDSWSFGIRGVAPLSDDIEVQAKLQAFHDQRTLRFEGADSSSEGADASIRLVGRGNWQFDAVAYLQSRNFSNTVISSTRFVRVLDQRNTPSTGLGGKLELRPPVSDDHVLRIGMDYRRSSGELQEEAYSAFSGNLTQQRRAGGRNSDFGIFLEDDWSLGKLVLTGGIRADRTVIENGFYRAIDASGALISETIGADRADWTFSYRAGAAYQVNDKLRVRAAAYRGLRLPTLNELYRPFVIFPVVTQANAALENEQLEGFEAGFDVSPARGIEFSLTAFDNRVENAIANVTLTPTLRQRQNLPAIDARGIEANFSVRRGQISLDTSLAYTDAEVEGRGASIALDGNRPPQTPEWAISHSVSWRSSDGWVLSGIVRHIGVQFESDQESDTLPAATTLGVYAQIPVSNRFALVLRGENLTDETIVTRNSGGAIDLGVPRTVWGGIKAKF
ncbi:TonB-dependent receptor [Pontixanthobacter gangjinensis]|uniref:TonB-dependent receptor n=1 Tax=Pontixanthobacter gangjinensis TaxID=1028742 RepID=A0A6I4SR53_9SPHN|nr:TonB-dependent receptor [Pontixanthobacter gangjinensis]MXO57888.1 TonB-dependent receptor [Pontixanthobacter gangjinensis]